MQRFEQRLLVTAAATAVAAALGAAVGYWLGRAMTLQHAQVRLDQYARHILTESDLSSTEARSLLATMNASPYPFCSDAEIAWFRSLIFQSEYLKDAGRMRNGRVNCSATLGHYEQTGASFVPDLSRADGTRIYRNLAPLKIRHHTVITLQLGDSFIVYDPWNLKDLGSASMHFTVTDRDLPSGETRRLLGEWVEAPDSILTTEGWARQAGSIYVTRCSLRSSACMTAFNAISEALNANRDEFGAYIALSGLCGALLGFAGCLFYFHRWSIEQQLRRAIQRDALHVVYQPIVDLTTRRIVGAEALVRWQDEDEIVASPEVFVKIAEERGFVGEITRLVVNRALREMKSTLMDLPGFRVYVNINGADLSDPVFLPMLETALAATKVPARCLGIEITESFTVRQQVAVEAIHHLRQKGHNVAIDDFGTGYSSLAYLHDLSADMIKIDRAFTRAVGTDSVTVSILPQILSIATALKLQVIVEGIETEQQASYFAATGQPLLAQGWLFGHPVPIEEFRLNLAASDKEAAVSVASCS